MATDFPREYALRSDEELLEIASDEASLTGEARAALDAEMRHRSLTPADVHKHKQLVEWGRRREAKRKKRKVVGYVGLKIDYLIGAFWTLLVVAVLTAAYVALPSRYHLPPDWEEAARFVMFASVTMGVALTSLWRKIGFWLCLLVSSACHGLLLHAWIVRFGSIEGRGHRGEEYLAILTGALLFGVVYGTTHLVRRKFGAEAASAERS